MIRIFGHGIRGYGASGGRIGFNNGSELGDDKTSDFHEYSEVIKPVEDIDCKCIIFFIDACYSGSAINDFKKSSLKSPIIVYTSGRSNEESASHTDNFIKVLDDKTADRDGNYFISLYEAYKSVYDEVSTFKYEPDYPQQYDPFNLANKTYLTPIVVKE